MLMPPGQLIPTAWPASRAPPQALAFVAPTTALHCGTRQLGESASASVGQCLALQAGPLVLHDTQYHSMGGQALGPDRAVEAVDPLAHLSGPVGGQTIPDDEQWHFDLPLEGVGKPDDLRALDRALDGSEAGVQAGSAGHCRQASVPQRRCSMGDSPSGSCSASSQPARNRVAQRAAHWRESYSRQANSTCGRHSSSSFSPFDRLRRCSLPGQVLAHAYRP